MNTATNAERFLNAFTSIETSLNRILETKEYVTFSNLLKRSEKKLPIIKNNFQNLKEYSELRNAIVHQRGNYLEVIAEPTTSVVEDIEHIANVLDRDQNVLSYASTPVVIATCDMTLKKVYSLMKESNLSKIPIYENNNYQGMITIQNVCDYFLKGIYDLKIEELLSEFAKERVLFMNRYNTIQNVIVKFDEAIQNKKEAPVILISEHGSSTELPLGIITSGNLSGILTELL